MPWTPFGPSRRWVDITGQITPGRTAGTVRLQRDGHVRRIEVDGLTFAAAGSGTIISGLAAADRPSFTFYDTAEGVSRHLRVTPVGNFMGYNWSAGVPINGQLTWSTEGVA